MYFIPDYAMPNGQKLSAHSIHEMREKLKSFCLLPSKIYPVYTGKKKEQKRVGIFNSGLNFVYEGVR